MYGRNILVDLDADGEKCFHALMNEQPVTVREIFSMCKYSHSFNKFSSVVPYNGEICIGEEHDMVDWARLVMKQISSSCQIT
jgi:hypothetical protein